MSTVECKCGVVTGGAVFHSKECPFYSPGGLRPAKPGSSSDALATGTAPSPALTREALMKLLLWDAPVHMVADAILAALAGDKAEAPTEAQE